MDRLIFDRAQSAMLSRDYALAARLYKTLLKVEPDNADILNALGSLYVKSNEDEKAIPYYESILTFNPHDVNAMNSLGGIYRRTKQYEKGIEILERALEENKKTAMINYTLGFIYKDMGNWDDAIDCFENVVNENPTDVLAYNHLGVIFAEKKNYPKAVQSYRRGLQTDPNHPILHYNLGHAYEAERNYAEAVNNYELALKSRPGWIDAIRDVVALLLKLQNTKRAMAIVQKSVQLYPSNADLIALSGNVQLKRYDFSAAQKAFEKADRIKPNDPSILLKLAESFEKEYMPGDAASWAKEANVLGLRDNNEKKRYVHIMLSAGEMERAEKVLSDLMLDAPSDAGVLDAQAQYYILNGDEAGKEEMFQHIPEMNPRYRHHYLEAARRYCQAKKYEQAMAAAEKYIEMAPLNPAGYNIKGRIAEKMGNLEEAVKTYKIAANLKYEDVYAKLELKRLGQEWNKDLQSDVSDYINQLNRKEKEEEAARIIAEEQAAAELEEKMIEKEVAEFDFAAMGDTIKDDEHVPALAELGEDEGFSGLDEIDDDTDRLMENEKEGKEDALAEIMASKGTPVKTEVPEEDLESEVEIDPDEFLPDWDEPPVPQRKSREPMEKTEPVDPDDFLSDYSGNDAMDMLREDTEEPKMDSRLVDKIDDAVEDLEEKVSDAQEKAEEAMRRAEELAEKLENTETNGEYAGKSQAAESEMFSDPSFSNLPNTNSFDGRAPSPSDFGPVGNGGSFDEPDFDAPFELKDPFDNPVVPDSSAFDMPDFPSGNNVQSAMEPAERAIEKAKEFLPNIVKIVEDDKMPEQFKSELGLFSKLRSLSDYLPAEKKEEFLSSKTRMLMDYVIGKMSGKPGLVKTVENLLKSGILETDVEFPQIEKEASELTGNELARKVIEDLKNLTADLEDQYLATALKNSADEVLGKLDV